MTEQTIKIRINGEDREVYAGNASLMRYRRAGGKMSLVAEIDSKDNDSLFDSIDAIALLIQVNLVERNISPDEIINGVEDMQTLFNAAGWLFNSVPWLVGKDEE